MRRRLGPAPVAFAAALLAVVTSAAPASGAGTVRVERAVADPAGSRASVTYSYVCGAEVGAVRFAVRLTDTTGRVASEVTLVQEPQVCDGARRTRTDLVAATAPGWRPGNTAVARVLMSGVHSGVALADLTPSNAMASAARALTLG
ncbi:hypothetical protein [Streptomyces sp. NPDC047928]|uniref:hypothetical protein n=1 Tax=unclassified Streptomyces TaxID=2593676 RepID=UPI0037205C61